MVCFRSWKGRERFPVRRIYGAAVVLAFVVVVFSFFAGCGRGWRGESRAPAQHTFTLVQRDGSWWFQTPSGKPFVSLGVNHLEPVLICSESNRDLFAARFGDDLIGPGGKPNLKGRAARAWVTDGMRQIRSWGFNTLGLHNPLPQTEMPYVAKFRPAPVNHITEPREFLDPFAPDTAKKYNRHARCWCRKFQNDPHILGISFVDMPWWQTPADRLHPWVDYLRQLPAGAPGKKRWLDALRKQYADAAQAAATYGVEDATWKALAHRREWPDLGRPSLAYRDSLAFLPEIADAWYGLQSAAIRACDTGHLIFGDKLIGGPGMPEWLDPILAKHVDVIYIQWYDFAENQLPRLRRLYERTGKPILLGDSSFSCPHEKLPDPKGTRVESPAAVGEAFYHYLQTVMAEPYVVGWHHCGYIEGSPDLKKFHRFYAQQSGFLRADGTPYTEIVDRVTAANHRAFAWHEAARAMALNDPDEEPAAAPICDTEETELYDLARIGERIFNVGHFKKLALTTPKKNISWIETDAGVVVIDAGYRVTAKLAAKLIRETTDKPIRFLIYTHHHRTQVGGAPVLVEPGTQVIAHENLVAEFDLAVERAPFMRRLNSIQFDISERETDGLPQFVYPDITYRNSYYFELGGVRFELYHVEGEAADYTVVWLPAERVVFVADLLSMGTPMVASPMKRVRDEVKWRQALELVRDLRPRVLVDSSLSPLCDPAEIDEALGVYIGYLNALHRDVIEAMNRGDSLEETLRRATLAPHLRHSPWLRDRYGKHEFNVRGLYHRYSGWFDQNGSHLNSAPSKARAASFIEQMGGGENALAKARQLRPSQPALALEYLDLLIAAGDHAQAAHGLKGEILLSFSEVYRHSIVANMYRRLGKNEREKAATTK
ncbi:MAG: alkyl sulfatase dimerization domain-containing protein [Candidatus Lernaella stagnicola]|nr:alkyl sulfatase dimerization domain-containing protein [Candidatus Lernaella stagnicola]